ncbi:uncharacterized protein Nmag_3739 (plasmid) [Natrialba magadii ATCC 43099]|uniref:Uncharacterized protein n=1 Tax=Natrialba magadii (strain ATCC 43099 / DSM 3394 / CCM 3739 / CIP 104546 / IAM 13178 / JCM 8861 / NBRC 102185 / NCIMB 2190 / MS3) TaxID=547559 RepID=D3T122_NATMM|nr:hypothetical protein [Natrialba magadii]ADD07281.1 uncharacterized protein Nmag_3739 [Natrialba magadii ATCC 43099]ELY34390.1 hypothetical protein C500_00607 [Natrialba magadii ATCC 43099]
MVEQHLPALEGERVQYSGDTWELTGEIDIKQNGELIHAKARTPDRVRGSTSLLGFTLESPPASLNPGNPGNLSGELEQNDTGYELVVRRPHATTRYRLNNLRST